MQQNHVLAQLKEYFETHRNDKRLMNTIQYLDACNKLFERGLLSHEKISVGQRNVIELMEDGFWFLVGWCDDAILNNVSIESNRQKTFLSVMADLGFDATDLLWI